MKLVVFADNCRIKLFIKDRIVHAILQKYDHLHNLNPIEYHKLYIGSFVLIHRSHYIDYIPVASV